MLFYKKLTVFTQWLTKFLPFTTISNPAKGDSTVNFAHRPNESRTDIIYISSAFRKDQTLHRPIVASVASSVRFGRYRAG